MPPTSQNAAADLVLLGLSLPRTEPFRFATDGGTLGIAWALAGSHLGNLVMLRQLESSGCDHRPVNFLSDISMRQYWKGLLPDIERPLGTAETLHAVAAAHAVFDHFLATFARLAAGTERIAA